MSRFISYLTLLFAGLYAGLVIYEFARRRSLKAFVLQILGLMGLLVLLHATFGFPRGAQAFGEGPSLKIVFAMLASTVLGSLARYLFYLHSAGQFSALNLVRPILISPLILLPLLSSIPNASNSFQVISFLFLAFQNGFFWRTVFENTKANKAK